MVNVSSAEVRLAMTSIARFSRSATCWESVKALDSDIMAIKEVCDSTNKTALTKMCVTRETAATSHYVSRCDSADEAYCNLANGTMLISRMLAQVLPEPILDHYILSDLPRFESYPFRN